MGPNSTEGAAKIIGNDPMNLQLVPCAPYAVSSSPYLSRYPSACLVYNGVWYLGTYAMDNTDQTGPAGTDVIGPLVGFGISQDYGLTWSDTTLTPSNNLFQESAKNGNQVNMGMPHFVDLGNNMEYSPDGNAYLIAHGALLPQGAGAAPTLGLFHGDLSYLARTVPSPQTINTLAAWEFYAGKSATGEDIWTNNFAELQPVLEWYGHMGGALVTYNAPLKKFLWFVTDPSDADGGFTPGAPYNTYVLESDHLTGPSWSLVTYMQSFGQQAYWVNIPSKFISTDGRTAWLCYSANWNGIPGHDSIEDPPGSAYGLCLHEITLLS
jgi:hypothetical protein